MDPTFAAELEVEWSRLQDFLDYGGPNFSFEDPYVSEEFPILHAQYLWCRANVPGRGALHLHPTWGPGRRAIIEKDLRDILETIPGFNIQDDPYYPYYENIDNQPPIHALGDANNPPPIQEEDDAAQMIKEVERLQAFLAENPDFPLNDNYLAMMFPTLYSMRQSHQRITSLIDALVVSTTTTHEVRSLLARILRVTFEQQEEEQDQEEEDPEEPPLPNIDHDHRLDGREPNEEEEQEEPPPLEENQAQDNEENMEDFEPEEQGDPGDDSSHGRNDNEEDGFLTDPEMDDYGWLLPVDAPVDWEAEFQWRIINQQPVMPPPPSPPAPMEIEDPESEVENADPPPPPPRPSMARPTGIPWNGHHSDYSAGTYVYIQLEPLYPCPWKIRAQSAFLGPLRIIAPCHNGYYFMAVPPGFQEHYTDQIHYSRVARARPENEHRIIPANVDFMDHITYTEMPIHQEPYYHRNTSRGQQEPQWRVTWRCYGLTEDSVEPQHLLAEHYPELFY
ncbi:hypothetical protein RHMOL_Rhmol05G0260700 [Rhododendron molle]|uniref:Uncharacterized protein n=1 Tax=Rhododendron molle TaxID=49168 RepID=A0ACC0NTA9_RHOML|nr:hypothetical protein RHMOL_Rhmol05G0260700 [Rhododendron molle]